MKKRIFASFLAVVMVAALLPAMAFAEPDTQSVQDLESFEGSIHVPQIGDTLDYFPTVVVNPEASATLTGVTWYKTLESSYNYEPGAVNDWTEVTDSEIAEDGYLYKIKLKMEQPEGVNIAQDADVSFNTVGLSREVDSDNGYWISDDVKIFYVTSFFKPLPQATELTKFEGYISVPVVGEEFDYAPETSMDPEGSATIDSVKWYKILKDSYDYTPGAYNEWTEVGFGASAEEGYLYKVVIGSTLAVNCGVSEEAEVSLNGVGLAGDGSDAGYIAEDNRFYVSSFFLPLPQATEMTKFEGILNVPHVGEALDTALQADIDPDDSATIDSVKWYKTLKENYKVGDFNDWTEAAANEIAEEEYVYKIMIGATLAVNCAVSEDAEVSLNGVGRARDESPDAGYYVEDNRFYVSDVYYPVTDVKELTKFFVTLNTPQVGKKLDYAPKTEIDPEGGISVESVTWYKIAKDKYSDAPDAINDWVMMNKDEVAEKGYLYTAVIKAPFAENYIASDELTVKLNDKALPVSLEGGTNMYFIDEGVLFMFSLFEPTAEETATPTVTKVAPKTGDTSSMSMWIVVLAAGVAAGAVAVSRRRNSGK